jgi:SOS-response transcriptional repressor LexA
MSSKNGREPKRFGCGGRVIHRDMKIRRSDLTYEESMEAGMSPMQKEVFIVIDEWWKRHGFSPSLRDIAYVRGKPGIGSTKNIVDRLVKLGVIKKLDKAGRTIRPAYINFKHLKELE